MKLAVFDCDGTLVDSLANIVTAMQTAFGEAGLPPPEAARIRNIVGLSVPEAVLTLAPDIDEQNCQHLADGYRAAFRQMRQQGQLQTEPLFDGIKQLLTDLEEQGWLLAVATGKSDRGLRACLDAHGITRHFISLQTADRHPSKPHPAMLRQCLSDASTDADRAVIIGDTIFDMQMGRAANVRAIGVSWGYHGAADLMEAGADMVANDSAELYDMLHG